MTTETPINTATPETPQQPPAQQTPTSAATEGTPKREYTQAELDKMFADRAKQAENSTLARILKKLGLSSESDLDTAGTTIAEAQTLKQSQMTEAEKKQSELDKIIKERDTLKAQLEQQAAMIRERDIQGAVKAAVTTMKANDFDAIYLWAEKHHKDALNAIIDGEGKVDTKALDKLLETVKSEKPTYFTPATNGVHVPGSQSNANGRVMASDVEARNRASAINQRIIRGR